MILHRIKKHIKELIGYTRLEEELNEKENEIIRLSQITLDLRRQMKRMGGQKINIVFVCHRPSIWDSLKGVFEECLKDTAFCVTIVAIPNKKQLPGLGLNHEVYESEGAEEYFKDYPCRVINGYDYNARQWFDLRSLKPDFLFFQTPYNQCRPKEYHSRIVMQYADLCWLHYGICVLGGYIIESSTPPHYMECVKNIFAESKLLRGFYEGQIKDSIIRQEQNLLFLGYPRLDHLDEKLTRENTCWKHQKEEGRIRLLWLPRWNTEEGNCCFFDYRDKLLDYVEKNPGYELLTRLHPQCITNFLATGEMTQDEVNQFIRRYAYARNAALDTQEDYWKAFATSDILIADATSLLGEYFATGKPIIYCHKEKDYFSEFGSKLYEGFYVASNWEELRCFIEKLSCKEDELKEKRRQIYETYYSISDMGAGYRIKEYLKKQFYA